MPCIISFAGHQGSSTASKAPAGSANLSDKGSKTGSKNVSSGKISEPWLELDEHIAHQVSLGVDNDGTGTAVKCSVESSVFRNAAKRRDR